jgi:hydrogenase-1 operon protein HyaF
MGDAPSGNVTAILYEVRHALQRLAEIDEETVIDLQALPLAPQEGDRIEQMLGQGEVLVELHALGPSRIHETAFSGVWWVAHYNAENQLVGKYIEVAHIPGILMAQQEDLQDGLLRLDALLSAPAD